MKSQGDGLQGSHGDSCSVAQGAALGWHLWFRQLASVSQSVESFQLLPMCHAETWQQACANHCHDLASEGGESALLDLHSRNHDSVHCLQATCPKDEEGVCCRNKPQISDIPRPRTACSTASQCRNGHREAVSKAVGESREWLRDRTMPIPNPSHITSFKVPAEFRYLVVFIASCSSPRPAHCPAYTACIVVYSPGHRGRSGAGSVTSGSSSISSWPFSWCWRPGCLEALEGRSAGEEKIIERRL